MWGRRLFTQGGVVGAADADTGGRCGAGRTASWSGCGRRRVIGRGRDPECPAEMATAGLHRRPSVAARRGSRYIFVKESDPGREIVITMPLFDVSAV